MKILSALIGYLFITVSVARGDVTLPPEKYAPSVPSLVGALYCQMVHETENPEMQSSVTETSVSSSHSDFQTSVRDGSEFFSCLLTRNTTGYFRSCRFSGSDLEDGAVARTLVQILRGLQFSGSYCDSPVTITESKGILSAYDDRFEISCLYSGDSKSPSRAKCHLKQR